MPAARRRRLDRLARLSVGVVFAHVQVTIVHALAHIYAHVTMSDWQSTYIVVVILGLPIVSTWLLRPRPRLAYALLFLSMLGALLFGVYYHFLARGPDNVSTIVGRAWALPFRVTAVLLALTEAAGVVLGLAGLFKRQTASRPTT
jgi:hypothetical protein